MGYKIQATDLFDKQAKRLKKKYISLSDELEDLQNQLTENPRIGTPLGNNTYKIRLAVKSKGKGNYGRYIIQML